MCGPWAQQWAQYGWTLALRGPRLPRSFERVSDGMGQHWTLRSELENRQGLVGAGSGSIIRGNDIHDGEFGIFVLDGASPTIEFSEIYDIDSSGISISGVGCDPVIAGNAARSQQLQHQRGDALDDDGLSSGGGNRPGAPAQLLSTTPVQA